MKSHFVVKILLIEIILKEYIIIFWFVHDEFKKITCFLRFTNKLIE